MQGIKQIVMTAAGAMMAAFTQFRPVTAGPVPKTGKKKSNRGRKSKVATYRYGASLLAHFDSKGICWSAKKNKLRNTYGRNYV